MQINITGRHLEITNALREYVTTKIEKLGKYLHIVEAHIILSVEKYRHMAEVTLQAKRTKIHGQEETGDMYQAIDSVIDKIEKQIKKRKGKITSRKSKKLPKNLGKVAQSISESVQFESEEGATFSPRVIRTEKFAVKPMSLEEATLQMGLSQDGFLVFLNHETNQINVLYRRNDGNYGLIEPTFQ
ncbi:MAG TPA: ribosome-associated translation inhibitor RaiA [Candidatus Limnocylindrales bacterium]|nr:ribosome-associated translation inhibitor RaiA [Candidatus Limnocylindrales bacterium]